MRFFEERRKRKAIIQKAKDRAGAAREEQIRKVQDSARQKMKAEQDRLMQQARAAAPATPTNPRSPISVPSHMQTAQRLGMTPGQVQALRNGRTEAMNRRQGGVGPAAEPLEPLRPPEEIVGDLRDLLNELDDPET